MATEPQQVQCPVRADFDPLDPVFLEDPFAVLASLPVEEQPVFYAPALDYFVVTRYADVVTVLREFSAARTPTPEQLSAMGLSRLNPLARVMVRQMLFLDPPDHSRIRGLAACAVRSVCGSVVPAATPMPCRSGVR